MLLAFTHASLHVTQRLDHSVQKLHMPGAFYMNILEVKTACACLFVVCSMPWLVLKVLPAGYVGTSPWIATHANTSNKIKAMSTGMYAFYQVRTASSAWC
jgi:hypothetical protein